MFRNSNHLSKLIVVVVCAFTALWLVPGLRLNAQSTADAPILLNDQTPSIDAVIKPDNGASGAVAIELQNAAIRLTNDANVEIFNAADPRITMVTIQFADGTAAQTLHAERLPGTPTAQIKLSAQTALPATTVNPSPVAVSTLNQPELTKLAVDPALSLPVTTSSTNNMVRVEFSQGQQFAQLVDSKGTVLFNATTGSQINGIALRVAPGDYTVNIANVDKTAKSELLVALDSTAPSTLVDQPSQPTSQPVVNNGGTGGVCSASVHVNAATMRSGPGTGYTTTGFVTQNNAVAVGGLNKEGNWTLVQSGNTSAWVPSSAITLSGNCSGLVTYDIPTRDLAAQVPAVTNQSAPVAAVSGGPATGGDDHGGHESEGKSGDHKSNSEGGDD